MLLVHPEMIFSIEDFALTITIASIAHKNSGLVVLSLTLLMKVACVNVIEETQNKEIVPLTSQSRKGKRASTSRVSTIFTLINVKDKHEKMMRKAHCKYCKCL